MDHGVLVQTSEQPSRLVGFRLTDILRSIVVEANPGLPPARVDALVSKYLERIV